METGGVVILLAALGISQRDCRSFAQIKRRDPSLLHTSSDERTRQPHLLFLESLQSQRVILPTYKPVTALLSPVFHRSSTTPSPITARRGSSPPAAANRLPRLTISDPELLRQKICDTRIVLRLLKNSDWGAEVAAGSATAAFRCCAHSKWAEISSVT